VALAALLFAVTGLSIQLWRLLSLTASYDQGIFTQVLSFMPASPRPWGISGSGSTSHRCCCSGHRWSERWVQAPWG
jgi:hypothetical protein